jgi:hypothetical protein
MVQPYVPSVDAVGETSLIYLGGGFSHAVARGPVLTPDAGVRDRLWERQRVSPVAARTDQLDVAGAVLDVVGDRFGPTAYARIDLVDDGSGPLVLEAELVEPALFLDGAPGSAEHLAAVLASLAG